MDEQVASWLLDELVAEEWDKHMNGRYMNELTD
jgi:hypothetical protein